MLYFNAFARLGIPITMDTATIKKAYQAAVAQHHPEEDPNGFIEIHEAYKTAMAYAGGNIVSTQSLRKPVFHREYIQLDRERNSYETLFDELEEEKPVDLTRPRRKFGLWQVWLWLHWLPIPMGTWKKFFGSEAFRLCRCDQDLMDGLFQFLQGRIHTFGVFFYLRSRLWELEGWYRSEENNVLAGKVRTCIQKLNKQYEHYLKAERGGAASRRIKPLMFNYQALPYYFKFLATSVLFPVIFWNKGVFIFLAVLIFQFTEFISLNDLNNRQLGYFYPKTYLQFLQKRTELGTLIVHSIYAVLLHVAMCGWVLELLGGGF